ncbi:MAG TPA: class F sortase [Streptosporangiaceae bacterium]
MSPPPRPPVNWRARLAGMAAVLLIVSGAATAGAAALTQRHAPQPGRDAAGATASARGPRLARSEPVAVAIPAIGVRSSLLHLGLNADGTIQVPSVDNRPMEAAWYKYSVTPGQIGSAVIEGHVDTLRGPAVFFRLGALRPGNSIDVILANGVTAVFRVTGVREYAKDDFPTRTIYGTSHYAALHLITCGGAFDFSTGHYLSSTVVFASLVSSRR